MPAVARAARAPETGQRRKRKRPRTRRFAAQKPTVATREAPARIIKGRRLCSKVHSLAKVLYLAYQILASFRAVRTCGVHQLVKGLHLHVLAPVLFDYVLFCFTGTYPRPSLWPSACCPHLTGKLVVRASPSYNILVSYLVFVLFVFLPRIACREERRAQLFVLILCFLYFIALLTLGKFIHFLGMLACDHGNRPSQVLD